MARLHHWLALALAMAAVQAQTTADTANATLTGGGADRPAPAALRAPPPPPPPPPRDDALPSGEEEELEGLEGEEGEEEGGDGGDGGEGRCSFPGAPAHSSVSLSDERLRQGAVATYSCERGFELLGPARRVCGPNARWSPDGIPFCVLNVAAGKAPMQSSTEVVPQRAVDGSTSAAFSASTCSLTRPERAPWWYVNLLEPYMVQLVRLDFGKACCGAQGAATVVVRVGNSRPDLGSNPVCNRFSGALAEGRPLFLPCNPPMPGAFVSVHLEAAAGGPAQLALCEAFVYTDQALPMERCPQFRDAPPGSAATYNGKCYAFHSRQALPFRDALAFCRARGGGLVDESNPALQGFVSWELWRRHRSASAPAAPAPAPAEYWLGAVRDPQDRNNWKWLSGEDVSVSFWNLPGGEHDCARYDGAKGWLWSDTPCDARLPFICQHQPTACGRPEQPPNSTLSAPRGFGVGAEVRVTCDAGHLLVGPATRTCLPTGFYDEFPPVCKRVECGLPAGVAHGSFALLDAAGGRATATALGARVRYACDEGFVLRGRALLVCDADERWDGPPPACLPVLCEAPAPVANGRFSVSPNASASASAPGVRAGAAVHYACQRRFVLQGAKTLTCLPSGRYDLPPPHCLPEEPSSSSPGGVVPSASPAPRPRPSPSRPAAPPPTAPPSAPPPRPRPAATQRPHIIGATHSAPPSLGAADSGDAELHPPEDNEVPGSAHVRKAGAPGADLVPPRDAPAATGAARLNLGAIIALGVFGGFVFLAAIITTIVILIRRSRSATHYRHRASPDCNTVASLDSSGSEGRAGLSRYYRQAWENLHQQAGKGAGLDEPLRGAGELVVASGVARAAQPHDKKRHHHHHHHHHKDDQWRNHRPAAAPAPANKARY